MADPKMLLAALAAIAAGLSIIGFISLDWRFFLPPAPLRASSLSPLALRLGVGALSIRFDKSPLKKLDDGNPDTLPLLIDTPRTTRWPKLSFWHTQGQISLVCSSGSDYS